ncbi:hypothetical protein [Micromonospora coerulea]|uniref:hypothetical protein n=1 Tax=Micromonospora coerulea TaxID=47856 RepID=UPI001907742A|nr:hypothetical protein [Micromonospora veneta]
MSRRARRQRPATPAEQRQVREFSDLAAAALSGPIEQRAAAVRRMARAVERLRDPGSLADLSPAELHDVLAERHPDRPEQVRNP